MVNCDCVASWDLAWQKQQGGTKYASDFRTQNRVSASCETTRFRDITTHERCENTCDPGASRGLLTFPVDICLISGAKN